jgi:hypothetical protein
MAEEIASGTVAAQYMHGLMRVGQRRPGVVSYYGYDAGASVRQLADPAGVVTDTYAYDATGQLHSFTYPNGVAESGERTANYSYDSIYRLRGETVGRTVAAQYSYGLTRVNQRRSGTVSYYGYDVGASVRQLLASAGVVTDTYAYDAFVQVCTGISRRTLIPI